MNQGFELTERLVINPSAKKLYGGKENTEGRVELVQATSWKALIQCPHYSASIHVAMEVDGSKSYGGASGEEQTCELGWISCARHVTSERN